MTNGPSAATPGATTKRPCPQPFTAQELMGREIPPISWVVPGLLPEGLTIFAGKPKMGKSWLALGLALSAAEGGKALDKFAVERGEVLYLALEDSERRLQSRLDKLLSDAPPQSLHFETHWPRLDQGGLEHLDAWLEKHGHTRLVIIDTLARVRTPRKGNANIYDEDYRAGVPLKGLADKYGVAIVVIHHLRKEPADDPLDTVSGSTGLTAVADSIWVLKRPRGQADAFLFVTGRDVEDQELALSWNAESVTWTCIGDAQEHRRSEARATVLLAMAISGTPMSPGEVAKAIGRGRNTVKQLMWRMMCDGELKSDGSGRYTIANQPNPNN